MALDECLTVSLGLRAPSHRDLLVGTLERVLGETDASAFYTDPDLAPTASPGEIAPDALARLHRIVTAAVADERAFALWLGRHLTEARRAAAYDDYDGECEDENPFDDDEAESPTAHVDDLTPEAVTARIERGDGLAHAPSVRLAYARDSATRTATLFAGGEAYHLEAPIAFAAPLLADTPRLPAAALAPHAADPDLADLLAALLADGALVWA